MKFYLKTVLVCLLTFGFMQSAQAQFLKELGEKVGETVKETVSQKTDRKAGETTEDAMDGIFGARKKRKAKKEKEKREAELQKNQEGEAEEQAMEEVENIENESEKEINEEIEVAEEETPSMEGLFSGLGLGDMQSSNDYSNSTYSFDFTAKIEIETYDKDKKEVHNMVQSYGDDCMHAEMSGRNMLFDYKTQDMLTLDNEAKTASVMSMKWLTGMAGGNEEGEEAVFTKTGKTKTINGYLCHEYLITYEDGKMEAWFAPSVPFSYENHMSSFAKMFGKNSPKKMMDQGYVMELTGYDKKDEKNSHMLVLEISQTKFNVNLSEYTVKGMF